ncbi:MAG: hypothetical protein RID91_19055 [Azospirillaceae bacterium]
MILWDPTNPQAAYYHYRAARARSQAIDAAVIRLASLAARGVRSLSGATRRAAKGVRVPAPDGAAGCPETPLAAR